MPKTFENRDWLLHDWQPMRLRMDEDLDVTRRHVSLVEELTLVAALAALGAAILFLI